MTRHDCEDCTRTRRPGSRIDGGGPSTRSRRLRCRSHRARRRLVAKSHGRWGPLVAILATRGRLTMLLRKLALCAQAVGGIAVVESASADWQETVLLQASRLSQCTDRSAFALTCSQQSRAQAEAFETGFMRWPHQYQAWLKCCTQAFPPHSGHAMA